MRARAIIFDQGQVGLATYCPRALDHGEVRISTEFSCVSPGTELRCLRGGQTNAPVSAYVPGYALVGTVSESKSPALQTGERVFCSGSIDAGELGICWGGHCEQALAQGDACIAIPAKLDPACASLAALGGIARHGLTKSRPRAGEQTAVIGLGVLGQLSARLHAHAGARVVACDLSAHRVEQCRRAGIQAVQSKDGLQAALREHLPTGATLVVDCTGAPAVIPAAMALVRDTPWNDEPEPETRYLVQGSYAGEIAIPYHRHDRNDAFSKQLSFIFPRNRQKQDMEAFIRLAATGELQVDDLVSAVMKPADAPRAYARLQDADTSAGTMVFDWR